MLEGINILVADDNKLNQKIVGFVLKKQGAIVSNAGNGKEVIEFLKDNSCDAIVMDLQMPEMDGLEAAQHIRVVMKSSIPIIGLTANTLYGEAERCMEAGMDGCIAKPFEEEELCGMIFKHLQTKHTPNGQSAFRS